MKKIPLFLLAGMTLLFSCSKNDDAAPADPTLEAAKKLQKNIQGKWVIDGPLVLGRKVQPEAAGKRSLFGKARPQEVETNGTTGTNGGATAFIEFAADSTYILYDNNGQLVTGKFEAKSGDSIVLIGIGNLTGISVTGDKLGFKLFYNATSKTIAIVSNKMPVPPANDRAALLCRTWKLTSEASGADIIGAEYTLYDENDKPYTITIDSAAFTISTNGTYLIQEFYTGKLWEARMANWTWHPSKSDYFLYSWEPGEFDEDNDVHITALTASVLKLSEGWDENGDGIDDHFENWVLQPAR